MQPSNPPDSRRTSLAKVRQSFSSAWHQAFRPYDKATGVSPDKRNQATTERPRSRKPSKAQWKWLNRKLSWIEESCPNSAKICFFVCNFLIFSGGLVVLIVMARFLFRTRELILLGIARVIVIILLTSGVVIILLCLLGWLGVLRNSKRMMEAYGILLSLIMVLELIAIILTVVYASSLIANLKGMLPKILQNYDGQPSSKNIFSRALDYAHIYFKCCGINSWKDFQYTPWYKTVNKTAKHEPVKLEPVKLKPVNRTAIIRARTNISTSTPAYRKPDHQQFPISCCRMKNREAVLDKMSGDSSRISYQLYDPTCLQRVPSKDNEYSNFPCMEVVPRWFLGSATVIFTVALTVIFLQLAGVVKAGQILNRMARERRKAGRQDDQRRAKNRPLSAQRKPPLETARYPNLPAQRLPPLETSSWRLPPIRQHPMSSSSSSSDTKDDTDDSEEDTV